MQKIKRQKIALVAITIFSMLAIYGSVPVAQAVSLDSAKDTISDSSPSATGVTHTIVFDMNEALTENEYVEVEFHASINIAGDTTTCPAGTTEGASAGQFIRCNVGAGGLSAATTHTLTVAGTVNPAVADDYSVTVRTHESGGVEIEMSEMKIYVISDVTVTAKVPATLTFSIATGTAGMTIGSDSFDDDSSLTGIDFGTLDTGVEHFMGQVVNVSTNADDGFIVTVQQDGNLRNAGGSDIDKAAAVAGTWAHPAGNIADENTWGYMGITSDDAGIFTADNYVGFNGTNDPITILSHDGPVNGAGTGQGTARVGYKVEITALQEAGDYQNTLTYVCTPTY